MRNIWRLSIVFVIGVASFLVAVNKLNKPPFAQCQQTARLDQTYSATFDESPTVALTRYQMSLVQNGAPVDGARVCVRADMGAGGMSGMGVTSPAVRVGPGKYEVPVRFAMGGSWTGAVLVQRQGGDTVQVPISFDVKVV